MKLIAVLLALFATAAMAQPADMPSKAEILELLNKADQKVSEFERSLRAAKPRLEKADQRVWRAI
jgi:hypothetical protein